jgi:copper resistance protein B
MRRALLLSIFLAFPAGAASAQDMDHAGHGEHAMPAPDPHAAHQAPAADPHAGHAPVTAAPEPAIPDAPPPPPPAEFFADRTFSPQAMKAARAQLRREHGAVTYSRVLVDVAEATFRDGADGYGWEAEAFFGGDIHRFVLKTEGEGARGHGVEAAEVQALYSKAVAPYFDVQAGVRHDFEPKGRTYLAVGTEGMFPYWFDVEGAVFLSTKGEVLARVEGSMDFRLTQRLILRPQAELSFAAQDTRATGVGSGLSSAELGLRLRYEVRREFAPYVGVTYERLFGRTADYARAEGEDRDAVSLVAGIRAWF